MKKDDAIIVEQNFNVSKEKLWEAITNQKLMIQWFFENIPSFEPKVGFETRFVVESESRVFPHVWKIIEVIPYQKIAYQWSYDGYEGDSVVTFEIAKSEKGSLLKVTHLVTKDFPDDIPEFKRESCQGGWNWFVNIRLNEFLATNH